MNNINQETVSEQSISVTEVRNKEVNNTGLIKTDSNQLEKKVPKKHNGFLRNNAKKPTKKPTPDMHLHSNKHYKNKQDSSEVTIIPQILEPKQTPEEYEAFNFLRIKTGHNEKKFWENITQILNQKSFSDIKKSNLSLIGYAVLHDSNIVFDKLLSQFGNQVSQEEFINCIFKYGIHKNPEIISSSLKFYEKQFPIEEIFLQQLIKDFAAVSYRFETNDLLLSWLAPKMTPDLLHLFWTQAISHKNVPIILQSLHYKNYSQYLNKNLPTYEDSLNLLGRLHQIKQLLGDVKTLKKVDDLKESVIISKEIGLVNEQDFEPKIWLSDKSEQFKVIQEKLSDKKPTEVIVKRKRKIA